MASRNSKQPQTSAPGAVKPRHANPLVYFGTIAILVITVIAFIVAPSLGSGAIADDGLNFGSWDGKAIAFAQGSYFAEQVQEVKGQLEAQGYRDTGDQFFAYQVWRRAFENTAVHMALLGLAKQGGLSVSDSFLDSSMATHPAFVEDGAFSRRLFREASAGFKSQVRAEIRESAMKQRLVADTVAVAPSKGEIDFIKAMAMDERAVEYVAFPFAEYPDAARLDFARANAELFRRLSLSKITVGAGQREARDILSRVRSGALSFEDAARNHSKDQYATRAGDMGARFAWELRADFKDAASLDAIAALGAGEVSELFETPAGTWVFYRANEAAQAADFASAELLRSAGDYINRFEKGLIEDFALKAARDFAAAPGELADKAGAAGRGLKAVPAFPINFGNALDLGYFSLIGGLNAEAAPELSGAERDERFFETVFKLEPGAVSEPLVIGENVILLRVTQASRADESAVALIEAYYSGVLQEALSRDLASSIMADPRLKDNFLDTFVKVFSAN